MHSLLCVLPDGLTPARSRRPPSQRAPPPPTGVTGESPVRLLPERGVAAISGWACDAQEIIIELNGVPYRAGYPHDEGRILKMSVGDTDNGFSLLWNWNNLGAGTHTGPRPD